MLDGKYQTPDQQFGIQVIAEWAGNSPKVILRYYGRVRPQVFHQITQFNEQIKSGRPIEDFFMRRTPKNIESNALLGVAQKAAQYTAVRGEIEGNDVSDAAEGKTVKPLKKQHLRARNGKGENLTELPHLTITERTGFEPAEPLRAHGFSKPAH